MVELPAPADPTDPQREVGKDKVDRMALDFGNMLTAQLESQRMYFQDEVVRVEQLAAESARSYADEIRRLDGDNTRLSGELARLSAQLAAAEADRRALEKRSAQLAQKYTAALHDLGEERALGSSLSTNVTTFTQRLAERDARVGELEEQVRDLMFYLETQRRVSEASQADQEEIQGGQVVVQAAARGRGSPRRRGAR